MTFIPQKLRSRNKTNDFNHRKDTGPSRLLNDHVVLNRTFQEFFKTSFSLEKIEYHQSPKLSEAFVSTPGPQGKSLRRLRLL